MSDDVKLPSYPTERTYTCPGCKKPIHAVRVGDSCSYRVEHTQKNACDYKGPVPS